MHGMARTVFPMKKAGFILWAAVAVAAVAWAEKDPGAGERIPVKKRYTRYRSYDRPVEWRSEEVAHRPELSSEREEASERDPGARSIFHEQKAMQPSSSVALPMPPAQRPSRETGSGGPARELWMQSLISDFVPGADLRSDPASTGWGWLADEVMSMESKEKQNEESRRDADDSEGEEEEDSSAREDLTEDEERILFGDSNTNEAVETIFTRYELEKQQPVIQGAAGEARISENDDALLSPDGWRGRFVPVLEEAREGERGRREQEEARRNRERSDMEEDPGSAFKRLLATEDLNAFPLVSEEFRPESLGRQVDEWMAPEAGLSVGSEARVAQEPAPGGAEENSAFRSLDHAFDDRRMSMDRLFDNQAKTGMDHMFNSFDRSVPAPSTFSPPGPSPAPVQSTLPGAFRSSLSPTWNEGDAFRPSAEFGVKPHGVITPGDLDRMMDGGIDTR
jgi:hypothetical protein